MTSQKQESENEIRQRAHPKKRFRDEIEGGLSESESVAPAHRFKYDMFDPLNEKFSDVAMKFLQEQVEQCEL